MCPSRFSYLSNDDLPGVFERNVSGTARASQRKAQRFLARAALVSQAAAKYKVCLNTASILTGNNSRLAMRRSHMQTAPNLQISGAELRNLSSYLTVELVFRNHASLERTIFHRLIPLCLARLQEPCASTPAHHGRSGSPNFPVSRARSVSVVQNLNAALI